jgi:hypothetical protein
MLHLRSIPRNAHKSIEIVHQHTYIHTYIDTYDTYIHTRTLCQQGAAIAYLSDDMMYCAALLNLKLSNKPCQQLLLYHVI